MFSINELHELTFPVHESEYFVPGATGFALPEAKDHFTAPALTVPLLVALANVISAGTGSETYKSYA